jgi:hypothetical protein
MKKKIEIEFLTALEFVSLYTKRDLKEEKEGLEQLCELDLLEIISKVVTGDTEELEAPFYNFADSVNYQYCNIHNIFHEYEECPICALEKLGIDITE